LILVGVAMLVAELFLPSFGVVGFGGLIAFVIGSLLLFDTPESELAVDRSIIFAAAATLGGFTLVVGALVVRSQRRKPSLGPEGLIGEIGEVRERVAPRGKVFVHGEYWTAIADEALEIGERAQVVAVEGLQLTVRRAAPRSPAAA
jgi:membrane-bound serine protease (ClpP class)